MRLLITSLILSLSYLSLGQAKSLSRKPSSRDCTYEGIENVKHTLKNGETISFKGFRENKLYAETIACSDGSHGFFSYVQIGECLGVAFQDTVDGKYVGHAIHCEK